MTKMMMMMKKNQFSSINWNMYVAGKKMKIRFFFFINIDNNFSISMNKTKQNKRLFQFFSMSYQFI